MSRRKTNGMRRFSGLAGAAILVALAGGASAQPMQLPGAQPMNPVGASQTTPAPAPGTEKPRAPSMPAIRVAGEEAVLGRALRHNGGFGEARMTKAATGYGLRLSVRGYQTDNPAEPCIVDFGEQPVPLVAEGRPAGVPRYRLEASICPIVFDVLDGAVLVTGPQEPCVVAAAACRIDPRGLWGPDSRTISGEARAIETARGVAERAVREGYRVLTAKADAIEQRNLAREQAGFSAERASICRDYQREGQLGFCGVRITEARAASIRARLGITAEPKPDRPRPVRPPAPKPGPMPLQ